MSKRLLRLVVLGSALAAGLAVVAFALAVLLPSLGTLGRTATVNFPVIGPWLVVAGLLAAVVGLVLRGRVVTGVGIVAVLLSGTLVAIFVVSVQRSGGSVNVGQALGRSALGAGRPDARPVVPTSLHVSVYRPGRSPAPILFYVHGGAWISGTPDGNAADLRWFADQGWLVVSAEYRLADAARPTWDLAPADLACALTWTAANAGALGGDASRIVVAGDSAGGNLAINLGYAAATGRARFDCPGPVPKPVAVVAQYPAVDPLSIWAASAPLTGDSDPATTAQIFLRWYLGGTPAEHPDRVAAITSATYISRDAPRTLIISPDDDTLVPPAGVRSFAAAARSAGVPIEVVTVPFANHGFDAIAVHSMGNQAHRSIIMRFLGALPS